MKFLIWAFTVLLTVYIPFKSFSQVDCNPYFLLNEGRKWTSTTYNAKDKYQGKQSYEVLSVSEEGNALTATVKLISFDKKDEIVLEKEVEFKCENGIVELDMSKFMPEEKMESFKEMDVDVKFEAVTIPDKLEVGQYLDEGGIDMTINGPMKMNVSVKIQDRKVITKETVEVPAGIYEAYKINSIVVFETMMSVRESKNVDWVAKDVGVVRSEQYDKKGRLNSYTVLTEVN